MAIYARYTVGFHNASGAPIEHLRIEGGGVVVDLGTLAPRATVRRSFHLSEDGVLTIKGRHRGKAIEATLESYVTSGIGGLVEAEMREDGTVAVKRAWEKATID